MLGYIKLVIVLIDIWYVIIWWSPVSILFGDQNNTSVYFWYRWKHLCFYCHISNYYSGFCHHINTKFLFTRVVNYIFSLSLSLILFLFSYWMFCRYHHLVHFHCDHSVDHMDLESSIQMSLKISLLFTITFSRLLAFFSLICF